MSKKKHKAPRMKWLPKHDELNEKITVVSASEVHRWAAHHEAGHAVVGLLLGEEIDYVEVGADGSGFQAFRSPRWFSDSCGPAPKVKLRLAELDTEQHRFILGRIISGLAGCLMEEHLPSVFGFKLPQQPGHGDWENANALAAALAQATLESMDAPRGAGVMKVRACCGGKE
jgi:hypothetical protein